MRLLLRALLGLVVGLVLVGTTIYFAFPRLVAGAAVFAERRVGGLVPKAVHIPGFQIAYLEGGARDAEPLVLLHGIGANKDNWDRIAKFLTPHYRVIAADLPGFGDSSRPPGAMYRIPDQVERLHQLFEVLKLPRLHLGGNSMGGYIAAAYASLYPDQVASLWLLDPGGVSQAQPSEMAERIGRGERIPLFARDAAEFDQVLDFVMARRPFIPRPVKAVLVERAAEAYDHNLRVFDHVRNQSPPLEALVTQLPTPTLVVWGEADRVLHVSGAQVLDRLMPNAEVATLPGIGHLPMLEAPQQVAERYRQFRAGLAAP